MLGAVRHLAIGLSACTLLAALPRRAEAQAPSVWMQHVEREEDTPLVVRDDERALSRAIERALGRCARGDRALPEGRYTLAIATDAGGRAGEISGASAAVDACLVRGRVRARASSRYRATFDVAVDDPGSALTAPPPDVTGTGVASEPDRCALRLVPGGAELAVFEAGVTTPADRAADPRVHAFFMHGASWPLRRFDEMRHARTEPDGTLVFVAALDEVARGERLAGWVSVDGGRTMAYCDGDGAPFDPGQLVVAP